MNTLTTAARNCVVENVHTKSFDLLTDDERRLLDENSIEIEYKKGDNIAKQTAFASNIIFIEEGLVKVHLEGKPKDLILKIVPSGHLVGLSSIYDGNSSFLYSVTAYVPTIARLISVDVFKQLIRKNAGFAAMIINILNEDAALIYGRFFCMTRKQAHGRVADILLCLSQRVYKQKQFHLALSRNDLASLTGLSCESVIRIFKEFKDEGYIEVQNKNIKILDYEALERVSLIG